jgi:presenilin-like A22 family membrane protease
MKYDYRTMLTLVLLFFLTQFIGLEILYKAVNVSIGPSGQKEVVYGETIIGPRPELFGWEAFAWMLAGIGISTVLIMVIIWLKKVLWWKGLFFISFFLTISLALGVFLKAEYAFILAFAIAALKLYKPNLIIHNISQILMYGGIAILLVPLFDITWIIALLIVISIYDIYAVFKSKHMVKMALFQTQSKLFAGITVPLKKAKKVKGKKIKMREAIIGGGDVAFPLLFTGVVMNSLMTIGAISKEIAFLRVLIIPIVVSLTLLFLLIKGKEGKFYPAMPFITAGCLIAYGIILLL